MDFIKACKTNALDLGDFGTIACQAYTVESDASYVSPASDAPIDSSEDSEPIEAFFREKRLLVVFEARKSCLWFFKQLPQDGINTTTEEEAPPEIPGYKLLSRLKGELKAMDVCKSLTSTNASQMKFPPTPGSSQTLRAAQTANLRAVQANSRIQGGGTGDQETIDIPLTYDLFLTSVAGLVSYYLARQYGFIPLNYRTFVSYCDSISRGIDQDTRDRRFGPLLTNLYVHWSNTGSLIVASSTTAVPHFCSIKNALAWTPDAISIGQSIRIAPSGCAAVTVATAGAPTTTSEDNSSNNRQNGKRVKRQQTEEVGVWKRKVFGWLRSKGIHLQDLESDDCWVQIRLASHSKLPSLAEEMGIQSPTRDFLWPAALCFFYARRAIESPLGVTTTKSLAESNSTGISWLQSTPGPSTIEDPLEFAQQWFLGKAERDATEERRRAVKETEEETNPPQPEPVALYPSSPLYSRSDLQGASGVYPTPPDGVLTQPGAISLSQGESSAVSGPSGNTDNFAIPLALATGSITGDRPEMDEVPTQPAGELTHKTSDASLLQSASNFDPPVIGGNDDLFGDMDEEEYGNNGVEDADFDFFDDPDGEAEFLASPEDAGDIGKLSSEQVLVQGTPVPLPTMGDVEMSASADDQIASATSEVAPVLLGPPSSSQEPTKVEEEDIDMLNDTFVAEGETSTAQTVPEGVSSSKVQNSEPFTPLDPTVIEKTLQPSPDDVESAPDRKGISIIRRKESVFDPVEFNRKISLSDYKYDTEGRFNFSNRLGQLQLQSPMKSNTYSPAVAFAPPPKFPSMKDGHMLENSSQISALLPGKDATNEEQESLITSPISTEDDDDDDEDDALSSPADLNVDSIVAAKRKRVGEDDASTTSVESADDGKSAVTSVTSNPKHILQTDTAYLTLFEPGASKESLGRIPSPSPLAIKNLGDTFTWLKNRISRIKASNPNSPRDIDTITQFIANEGKEVIMIAQIVADQLIKSSFDLLHEDDIMYSGSRQLCERHAAVTSWHMNGILRDIFPNAIECDLPKYASIQDLFVDSPLLGKSQNPARPAQRRPNAPIGQTIDTSGNAGNLIYPISPPHIRVRRADTLWDLAPPAISFWESLGLAPVSGPKNVMSYCIYPSHDTLNSSVENFLKDITMAYEGCKYGSHTIGEHISDFTKGHVPWKITGEVTFQSATQTIRETCVRFASALSTFGAEYRRSRALSGDESSKIDAFVIYFVNPFPAPTALWELGAAFLTIFRVYRQMSVAQGSLLGQGERGSEPDLVFQIVPIENVASFRAPNSLDPVFLATLAREVYDRCPPTSITEDRSPLSIYAGASIQLEETLPRNIIFKLSTDPPPDLLRENSYMHIGYAISVDGTWVTASWTDNSGKHQASVSYCISNNRTFADIAREIWQTTLEVIQARRVAWRICLAKAGTMEKNEFDIWTTLTTSPCHLHLCTILLTVNTSPPVKLFPSLPWQSGMQNAPGAPSTPVTTPQPGVSPDQPSSTPAATPSDMTQDPNNDPDARLIDVTDETWGVVLNQRIHNSDTITDYNPAMISGLIVKRGIDNSAYTSPFTDNKPTPGPHCLGVNIVFIGGTGRPVAPGSFNPPTATAAAAAAAAADLNSPAPNATGPTAAGNATQERPSGGVTWGATSMPRSAAEAVLKEILSQYRGLGLLSRLKGMRGCMHGTVPWHIAASLRGVRGLETCLVGGAAIASTV